MKSQESHDISVEPSSTTNHHEPPDQVNQVDQSEIHSTPSPSQCQVDSSLIKWPNLSPNAEVTSVNSSSSSSGNASYYATASSTSFGRRWMEKMLSVREDTDKRLAKAYPSFIIGRFLGISSSTSLVLGLLIKFFFTDGVGSIIAYIIISISILVFIVASCLVIYATVYQSANARKDLLEYNITTRKSNMRKSTTYSQQNV